MRAIKQLYFVCERLCLLCCIVSISLLGGSFGQKQKDLYADSAFLYIPDYAQGFFLKEDGDNRILYVKKSWSESEYNQYILYPRCDSAIYKGKKNHIPYPIQNAICLSTTHIAYLDVLHKLDVITGISGVKYLSNSIIRGNVDTGTVYDIGYEGTINTELILSLHPDVVFAYSIPGVSTAYLKPLIQMELPVIFWEDFLEAHPLGKAEYMVSFSSFFDSACMVNAFSHFNEICSVYNHLCSTTHSRVYDPKVLMNAPFNEVWYIPGGNSYMAKLVTDAGGSILGSKGGTSESQPVGLEQSYLYAMEADFWLHPNAYRNLDDLANSDPRFSQIPAIKEQRVFNNTLRSTQGGGTDFWERGVTEPHLILSDLIKILHPYLLPDHKMYYYEQISNSHSSAPLSFLP